MAAKQDPLPAGAAITLTVIEGPAEGKRFEVKGTPADLGSSPGADVVLASRKVAEMHARLLLNEAGLFLEDLGSGAASSVNDLTAKRMKLQNGDLIALGDVRLLLQLNLPQPGTAAKKSSGSRTKQAWLVGFYPELRDWAANDLAWQVGADIRAFKGGEEVLVAISAAIGANEPPGLLILDLKLPIINGVNVAIAIRAFELGFNRPGRTEIVFLFNPPEGGAIDKIIEFLRPARLFPPGESDGFLRQRVRDLIKALPA